MTNRILKPTQELQRIDFYTEKFKNKVLEKGYDITWERMMICPCRKDFSSQPISNCINCKGLGYYWFEPKKIIGMISSVAVQKKFLQWTDELSGTAYLTLNPEYKVGWMDKIIVTSAETVYSEVCNIKFDDVLGKFYIDLRYDLLEPIKLLYFVDENIPLQELNLGEHYEIFNNKRINFTENITVPLDGNISILYKHNPVYLVIDTLNDYRNTYVKRRMPNEVLKRMPIRVMIKKAHLVV